MGHLKELQGCEQTSVISRAIEALHTDIHCLVSSPKTSQDTITSKGLWTHVARLAYQAEYVMDLYLIMPDSRCIVTLSNIVEELNEIKEKLLALMGKSLPVEDVPLTTSSHVHGAAPHVNNVFVGFHEEIDAMMKYLLGGENDLQAISVVGMAGAGKTSLAMHLFKESSVVGHFDIKVWCTVSQSYQMKDLLLTILNQINPDESDIKTMDDEDRYFPNDKTRSRILITTRDHNVASETMSNIHELQALTEGRELRDCTEKLPQKESLRINLVNIAKEVAKSCKGLPLSIVIVGGLMHSVERNEELWNQIAKDATSTILSDPEVTRLVRLWVAEGLVSGKTSEGSMEDVGRRYVDDLITRSLISPIKEKSEGGVKIFQLHDLLREFCLKKAKEEHFLTMLNDRGIFKYRYFINELSINHGMGKHLCFISMNSVRTIISFSTSNFIYADIELILESGPMMLLNVLDMHELVNPASYVHRFHLRLNMGFGEIEDIFIYFPSALFRCLGSRRLEDSSVLLENLKSLSKPRLHYGDSNWLSKLPELQKLGCIMFTSWDYSLQRYQFPELDLCNQLTSLKVENGAETRNEKELQPYCMDGLLVLLMDRVLDKTYSFEAAAIGD
ncbi:hypothetical protein Leryth_024143 [Lithospermum erythrorhizon]|nr:hypothetical protein Leryth_024143 [Lithospermum erythrorhizon]